MLTLPHAPHDSGANEALAAVSSVSAPALEQSAHAALETLSRTALQSIQPALESSPAAPGPSVAAKAAFYRPASHDPHHIEVSTEKNMCC